MRAIIDDVVVMRMDEDRYWTSTLYGEGGRLVLLPL